MYQYEGRELDLFAAAIHWKSYVKRHVDPYLGREVLEVGAGNGGTTRAFFRPGARRWVCLEPDASLADRIARSVATGGLPAGCQVVVGTLAELADQPPFDTLLYMDVLEHIGDDRAELTRAAERLQPGGHLIVLCPAHPWLFTAFDRAVGHHRRYTKRTLRAAGPDGLELVKLVYLDSVGMLASLGNRMVLRQAVPSARQIAVWDKLLVPLSRWVDPLLGHNLGKSVLAVWRRPRASRPPAAGAAAARATGTGRRGSS